MQNVHHLESVHSPLHERLVHCDDVVCHVLRVLRSVCEAQVETPRAEHQQNDSSHFAEGTLTLASHKR